MAKPAKTSSAEAWAASARFFEYTTAADPDVPDIPFAVFPNTWHTLPSGECVCARTPTHTHTHAHAGAESVDTAAPAPPLSKDSAATTSGCLPLDLSRHLRAGASCTSPNLLANFLILHGKAGVDEGTGTHGRAHTHIAAHASSHMFYVIRGAGRAVCRSPAGASEVGEDVEASLEWSTGDLFTIPAYGHIHLYAQTCACLYYVNDSPLFNYLGAAPRALTFRPTLYTRATLTEQLAAVTADPAWRTRNRNGVLLATDATCGASPAEHNQPEEEGRLETLTLTRTMWALYNALPAGVTQKPHKHNSVALDLCVAAGPNTYTLMAAEIDAEGKLVPPITRADWHPGAVFVTPPGMWHSHHNESDVDAIVLPVQDAGLHTFMRTLDIRFAP